MYVLVHVALFLFSYTRVMYFTRMYMHGLMAYVFLSLVCTCLAQVPFGLWVICMVF